MQERSEAERRAIMAMPQCCYLAKGAKRPSHTTKRQNSTAFHSIPVIRSKGSTSVLSTRKIRPIYSHPSMWWRKVVQYIKMTNEIDLSTMKNSKEILPQYRDQLEAEIKDIWAIGQNAITEMIKTVREIESSSRPLHKL